MMTPVPRLVLVLGRGFMKRLKNSSKNGSPRMNGLPVPVTVWVETMFTVDGAPLSAAATTGVRRELGSAWAVAHSAHASRAVRSARAIIGIAGWTLGQVAGFGKGAVQRGFRRAGGCRGSLPGAREPDRRAHGLQRRPGAPGRDRARDPGRGPTAGGRTGHWCLARTGARGSGAVRPPGGRLARLPARHGAGARGRRTAARDRLRAGGAVGSARGRGVVQLGGARGGVRTGADRRRGSTGSPARPAGAGAAVSARRGRVRRRALRHHGSLRRAV